MYIQVTTSEMEKALVIAHGKTLITGCHSYTVISWNEKRHAMKCCECGELSEDFTLHASNPRKHKAGCQTGFFESVALRVIKQPQKSSVRFE